MGCVAILLVPHLAPHHPVLLARAAFHIAFAPGANLPFCGNNIGVKCISIVAVLEALVSRWLDLHDPVEEFCEAKISICIRISMEMAEEHVHLVVGPIAKKHLFAWRYMSEL